MDTALVLLATCCLGLSVLSYSHSNEQLAMDNTKHHNVHQDHAELLERMLLEQREHFFSLLAQDRQAWETELAMMKDKLAAKFRNSEARIIKLEHQNHELNTKMYQLDQKNFDLQNEVDCWKKYVESNREKREERDVKQPSVKLLSRSDDLSPLETTVSQLTQQVNHMEANIQALQNANTQQDNAITQISGSTFIRWGSSSCPTSAELVYSGYVGGGDTIHTAGASPTRLCLPPHPVHSGRLSTSESRYSTLYGTEYQSLTHENQDSVCAVCRSRFATTIMLPAMNACPSGWTLQYQGDLMSSADDGRTGSEYVCVDLALEARPGSGADVTANELFFTSAVCGSLPCPPYVSGDSLTCVLCSK